MKLHKLLFIDTAVSHADSGIIILSLGVSLVMLSVCMFATGLLLGILIIKYRYSKSLEIADTQATEPCPTYEEISPVINTSSSAEVNNIDIVDNQAYTPINVNL